MFRDPLIRVFPVSATALIIQTMRHTEQPAYPAKPWDCRKWCWLAHQLSDLQQSDRECVQKISPFVCPSGKSFIWSLKQTELFCYPSDI